METATIRIPEEKKNLLKAVASLENKKMNDLIVDLIDEYVARRRETLEIMSVPGLYESIRAASREFRAGKSVSLKDARKKLEHGFSE
jgi:PHD/YefM family antitoxin component YafN of YafNO toxin-antitoxin module